MLCVVGFFFRNFINFNIVFVTFFIRFFPPYIYPMILCCYGLKIYKFTSDIAIEALIQQTGLIFYLIGLIFYLLGSELLKNSVLGNFKFHSSSFLIIFEIDMK